MAMKEKIISLPLNNTILLLIMVSVCFYSCSNKTNSNGAAVSEDIEQVEIDEEEIDENSTEGRLKIMMQYLDPLSYSLALPYVAKSASIINENGKSVKYVYDSSKASGYDKPYFTETFGTDIERYVLNNGEKIKYKPGVKTEDLVVYAAKEAIFILAYNFLGSDPTTKKEPYENYFSKYMYYMIMHDETVDEKIKETATNHFLAAAETYLSEEGNMYIEPTNNKNTYKIMFYPSHLEKKYGISFHYDDDGYLVVSSSMNFN